MQLRLAAYGVLLAGSMYFLPDEAGLLLGVLFLVALAHIGTSLKMAGAPTLSTL